MSGSVMTNRVVRIHLRSWRYLALLSLPPLILAFNLLYSLASVFLLMLFLVVHYFCWRLWLDERLLLLLSSEEDLAKFDEGMAWLWPVKLTHTRTFPERWRGVKTLFYRALGATLALWFCALSVVLYLALTLAE